MTFQVHADILADMPLVGACVRTLLTFVCVPAASASVNIGQLEQQLILSLDPRRIRQILIELHGMAERPFWRVNSKV